ncbi:MAG: diacylglycerol kinase family protein [Patescibacteria group bacterium]
MYVYLYDAFLRERPYRSSLKAIENRLTDFGISGKIIRLTTLSNAHGIIDDEMRYGAQTVVVVGGDETLGRVLSRAAICDAVFGYIPIDDKQVVARMLGIPGGADACDVLSRRRIVDLDVGEVNDRYFISQLEIQPGIIRAEYDGQFAVSSEREMALTVCNLRPFGGESFTAPGTIHPQDGKLEAFVQPVMRGSLWRRTARIPASVFPFREMLVRGREPFTMEMDNVISKEMSVRIRLAPKRLQMIVGQGRMF